MTHRRAVLLMILTTLLWSTAGIVSRQLESARGFEVTFWRSAFNSVALVVMLSALRGPRTLWLTLRHGGRALWLSGVCWAVMFTAFMVALTLTKVANVLVTMALAPLFTALLSHFVLGHRLNRPTWATIAVAGVGIGWMYGGEVGAADSRQWLGTLVALAVPMASAVNWTLLHHLARWPGPQRPVAPSPVSEGVAHGEPGHDLGQHPDASDMLPAVLLGALMSSLLALPLAWPFSASGVDLGWLAFLGVVQLALPCLMAVSAARHLSAPQAALLALLEVVFGVAWVWWGAGEAPSSSVLFGGLLVLAALIVNEAWALRRTDSA